MQQIKSFGDSPLKEAQKLRSVDVKLIPGDKCSGSDPKQMIQHVIGQREDGVAEEFWCVFDCDNRANTRAVLEMAAKNNIKVAFSRTCFEFWFLLHYKYTTRKYASLKELLPDLEKVGNLGDTKNSRNSKAIYSALIDTQVEAIKNAKALRQQKYRDIFKIEDSSRSLRDVLAKHPKKLTAEKLRELDPFTDVDILVEVLNKLA